MKNNDQLLDALTRAFPEEMDRIARSNQENLKEQQTRTSFLERFFMENDNAFFAIIGMLGLLLVVAPYQLWIKSAYYSDKSPDGWFILCIPLFWLGLCLLFDQLICWWGVRGKPNRNVRWAVIGVPAFFAIRVLFAAVSDYNAYQYSISSSNVSDCERYFEDFPNGRYHEAVYSLYDTLNFQAANNRAINHNENYQVYDYQAFDDYLEKFAEKGQLVDSARALKEYYLYQESAVSKRFPLIMEFFGSFPESRYRDSLNVVKNALWAEVIATYEKTIARRGANVQATKVFKAVLQQLKNSNQNKIYVKFERDVSLKNIEDYPQKISPYLDLVAGLRSDKNPLPSQSNIYSATTHFHANFADQAEKTVLSALKSGFAYVFNEDFVSIEPYRDDLPGSAVIITVSYQIGNNHLEFFGTHVPELIPYTQTEMLNSGYGSSPISSRFMGYVPGLDITFKFKLAIPETGLDYSPAALQASPAGRTYHVESVEDAYSQLVESSFEAYCQKVPAHFGIRFSHTEWEKFLEKAKEETTEEIKPAKGDWLSHQTSERQQMLEALAKYYSSRQ